MKHLATRRALLRGAAYAALIAAVPNALAQPARPVRRFFLTEAEADFLAAAVDRILPKDEWPSASEAGVVDFIDLQLATGWGEGIGQYLQGPMREGTPQQGYQLTLTPAELFRLGIAAAREQVNFTTLNDADKDAFLRRCENGEVRLGPVPGKTFFEELRQLTLEGFYADPAYNGNRGAVAWRMIGFPGPHAYYLTEIDRHDMLYDRAPQGMAWQPGLGEVQPFTADRARERQGAL